MKSEQPVARPQEGDYVALVNWIEQEKKAGRDHLRKASFNRSEMARRLSDELGWAIDVTSLNRAIARRLR